MHVCVRMCRHHLTLTHNRTHIERYIDGFLTSACWYNGKEAWKPISGKNEVRSRAPRGQSAPLAALHFRACKQTCFRLHLRVLCVFTSLCTWA